MLDCTIIFPYRIARVNSHNGWDGTTADYSSARSDPLYLKEGNQYLLVGDMVEVYGADYLRVSLFAQPP